MNAFEGYLVEARTTTDTFSSSAEIWGSWLVLVEADDPYHAINCSDSADFIAVSLTNKYGSLNSGGGGGREHETSLSKSESSACVYGCMINTHVAMAAK